MEGGKGGDVLHLGVVHLPRLHAIAGVLGVDELELPVLHVALLAPHPLVELGGRAHDLQEVDGEVVELEAVDAELVHPRPALSL